MGCVVRVLDFSIGVVAACVLLFADIAASPRAQLHVTASLTSRQSSEDGQDVLFRQRREFYEAGKYAEAIPKAKPR
jgi:hypothetical protein